MHQRRHARCNRLRAVVRIVRAFTHFSGQRGTRAHYPRARHEHDAATGRRAARRGCLRALQCRGVRRARERCTRQRCGVIRAHFLNGTAGRTAKRRGHAASNRTTRCIRRSAPLLQATGARRQERELHGVRRRAMIFPGAPLCRGTQALHLAAIQVRERIRL